MVNLEFYEKVIDQLLDSFSTVIECIAWGLLHLCALFILRRRNKNRGFGHFPDNVLTNILSRLPADDILRCRKVCRHWRTLTSSSYFITMQDQRAPTVILVQGKYRDRRYHFVYDALAKKLRNIPSESRFPFSVVAALAKYTRDFFLKSKFNFENNARRLRHFSLVGACGPLLHIQGDGYSLKGDNYVFNLFTRQLGVMNKRMNNEVCGIFFNETRNEYNYLCLINRVHHNQTFQFYVYNLASRSDGEIARSRVMCGSCSGRSPVVVNRALYFMVYLAERHVNRCKHVVLVFEMDSRNFYTFPHPELGCGGNRVHHSNMYLFVHEGRLCLGYTDMSLGLLDMWILEDHANWHWVPLCSKISLPLSEDATRVGPRNCTFLSVGKDELLVYWDPPLFLVNLKDESVEEIKMPFKFDFDYLHRMSFEISLVAYRSTVATPHLVWDIGEPPLFRL